MMEFAVDSRLDLDQMFGQGHIPSANLARKYVAWGDAVSTNMDATIAWLVHSGTRAGANDDHGEGWAFLI
jgi:hypothetical protein